MDEIPALFIQFPDISHVTHMILAIVICADFYTVMCTLRGDIFPILNTKSSSL